MVRKGTTLICILAGAWCLVTVLDSRGWLKRLWDVGLPVVILDRKPSPTEVQSAEVEKGISEVERHIDSILVSRKRLAAGRSELLTRLQEQIAVVRSGETPNARRLVMDNPIVTALVRSIDAEDRRDAELAVKFTDLRRQLERMQARLITLRTGTSLIDVDEPRAESNFQRPNYLEDAHERYERILNEAMSLSNP